MAELSGNKVLEIISGRKKKPYNAILIGTPGIGKSTWAASAEAPIFIGAEENDELDVDRFPTPETFDDALKQLGSLISTPKKYKTVVVDTLDSIEKLAHKKILSQDPKKTGSMMQAHGGYAKAYEKAATELLNLKSILKTLRDQRGMNIILLAHSKKTKAVDTVLGLEYDSYETALHKDAQAIFVDWVSAVLYASYIATGKEGQNSDKVFAMGHGQRIVYTEKRPGHLAKNRYQLPYEMNLEFSEFLAGYNDFYSGNEPTALELVETIKGMVLNIQDAALVESITKTVDDNKENITMLKRILARVKDRIGEK